MSLNSDRTLDFVQRAWDGDIIPALTEYIRIPAKSPMYDAKWAEHGHLERAVTLITDWARARKIEGLTLEVVRLPGRTPVILMETPGAGGDTVLLYGHCDKQPEMVGWAADGGPWTPVRRRRRLRRVRRAHRDRGAAGAGRAPLALRGAHRSLGRKRQPGSAGVCREARRSHPAGPRRVPRFRVRRLRAPVGDHVAARSGERHAQGRGARRGRALGRGQRHRAVELPPAAPGARPPGGHAHRRDPRARVPRGDPAASPGRSEG